MLILYICLVEISTSDANCTTGGIRLMIGTELSTNGSGRLEVCFNNAWGTVCDRSFDDADAAVACSQVNGFQRSGMSNCFFFKSKAANLLNTTGALALPHSSYPVGSGPIFLSELECAGSEFSLTSCFTGHNLSPGLVTCNHSMDVSIQCQGMIIKHIIMLM